MSESSMVWAPLKREFDKLRFHYTRIENSADPGTPDVNVHILNDCIDEGTDTWLELKAIREPSTPSAIVKLGLRKEQYVWLSAGMKAGRNCHIVVRMGKSGGWLLLSDGISFSFAKHPTEWSVFLKRGLLFRDVESLILQLRIFA